MSDLISRMQMLSLEYERELQTASRKIGTKEAIDCYMHAAIKQNELAELTSGEASKRHKRAMNDLLIQIKDDIETYKINVPQELIDYLKGVGVVVNMSVSTTAFPASSVPCFDAPASSKHAAATAQSRSKGKQNNGNNDDNLHGFSPDDVRLNEIPDVSFEEFGDMDESIRAIVECLQTTNMKRLYPKLSEQMSERKQNILLYGPPGGGKTHFCKAIGNYVLKNFVGGTFYLVKAAQIKHSLVNVAESRLNALFQDVQKYEMPVVCIDEIDALFPDRDESKTDHVNSFVTEFLQHIDGVNGKTNAVIIGATNFPWKIDRGVRSRMPVRAYVGLPDRKHMVDFLQRRLDKYLGNDEEYADDIIRFYADRLENASYRELESIWLQVEAASFLKTTKANPNNRDVDQFLPISREESEEILERVKISHDQAYIDRLMDVKSWDED